MAETKWTPGPWEVGLTIQNDGGLAVITTKGRDRVAKAWSHSKRTSPLANARLVAAAPELASALEWLIEVADEDQRNTPAWETAVAALAKARGE